MAIDTSNPVIAGNMVALARKRQGNARSKMLKMIMPMLSRENGDQLAKAIQNSDSILFRKIWEKIKGDLSKKLESKRHTSHSSSQDDLSSLLHEHYGDGDVIESLGNDVLVSMSASNSGLLLVGNGAVKEELRDFLANGVVRIDDNTIFKIVSADIIRSRFASAQPVTYRVQTQLIDMENETVAKTFTNTGLLVEALSDALLIAKSYHNKRD